MYWDAKEVLHLHWNWHWHLKTGLSNRLIKGGSTMIPLALLPRALARVMYSDLVMQALGRPRNSRIMSRGRATRPAPQNTMNSSHPTVTLNTPVL